MSTLNHDHHAGLAISLAHSLEPDHPIARKAQKHGSSTRAELDALVNELLDASDDALGFTDDGLLDPDFDD